MKDILTLVDFTDTAEIAVDEALSIAAKNNFSVSLCHIAKQRDEKVEQELREQFSPYLAKAHSKGIEISVKIGYGQLRSGALEIVERYQPQLVVVGTHGKHGLKQNLLGANIYKMVRELPTSVLVVNDNTTVVDGSFKNILLPVAPHENYLRKVKKACELIAENGRIELFAIMKPGVRLDDSTLQNIDKAKSFLEENGIKYDYVKIDSQQFSVAYSRETIEYAAQHDFDLICIMSQVSSQNKGFGNMDKETVLLNEQGLPVLLVNS